MFNEFCITSILTSTSNKQIIIETNFKVDVRSINNETVKLISSEHGLQESYKLDVKENKIILTLTQWPKHDIVYSLSIKEIKDMLNRQLRNSVQKDIQFKTAIKTKAYLTSPVNNQAIKTNTVLLTAGLDNAMSEENESLIYRFEISSDVAFFDIISSITTEQNQYQTILNPGQYYSRTRLESKEDYSDWSQIITFIVIDDLDCNNQDTNECEHSEIIDDLLSETEFFTDDYLEDLEIIDRTPNGTTPEEIHLYFNKPIRFISPKMDLDNDFANKLVKIGTALGYRKEL